MGPEGLFNPKPSCFQTDCLFLVFILFMIVFGGHPLEGQTCKPNLFTPGNLKEN